MEFTIGDEKMKYLILGVNGMAGHMIALYLLEQGHMVYGFARSDSPFCNTICGEATKKEDLFRALSSNQFDYVINCIGILNQFVDAKLTDGIYLNSVFPHLLKELLEEKKTKLIQISSDCVFDGKKGKYTESDLPDAASYYGKSKALGEILDDRNLTIRTSIIGPELKSDGIGLFHWFMSQKKEVYGYQNVIWSGVTTLQLAKFILQDRKHPQTGLYHLVNNQYISKYELLTLLNHYFRKDKIEIKANFTEKSDKTLVNTRSAIFCPVPTYDEMVSEMAEWFYHHKEFYQQYQDVRNRI